MHTNRYIQYKYTHSDTHNTDTHHTDTYNYRHTRPDSRKWETLNTKVTDETVMRWHTVRKDQKKVRKSKVNKVHSLMYKLWVGKCGGCTIGGCHKCLQLHQSPGCSTEHSTPLSYHCYYPHQFIQIRAFHTWGSYSIAGRDNPRRPLGYGDVWSRYYPPHQEARWQL